MIVEQWHLGLLLGVVALHVLFSYGVYRRYHRAVRDADVGTGSDAGAFVDRQDGVVECPECGTDNELGYRFCRSCVGELPGAAGFQRASDSPMSRMTR